MFRNRLMAVALASSLLFTSGCLGLFERDPCQQQQGLFGHGCLFNREGGLFSRFRTASRNNDCDCIEFGNGFANGAPIVEGGPVLQDGAFPPPPRIVPVPQQAGPKPYTP
ncbi:MAG: hypothetical protein L0Y72_03830 [Gemmataceae bacterium]|nr:hypothetical protein [Gemmataceae bacterium]MCI0738149.1 hypothetical protein [Gemmataceae bacterium]